VQGDLILIDNWAVAHRAREGSFDSTQGVCMYVCVCMCVYVCVSVSVSVSVSMSMSMSMAVSLLMNFVYT